MILLKRFSQSHQSIIQAGWESGKRSLRSLPTWLVAAFVLLCALALKIGLLAAGVIPFNADEAVVGLMARHMLAGHWPVFFYGQAYMGSLDASLVSLGFALFGPRVSVIRAVQILLYAGTVSTSMLLAWDIFQSKKAAWISGMFMAIPTVNVTLYTTVSLGGYGEALLIGNLLLMLALRILKHPDRRLYYALWGLLAGLGFWAFGLTLVYSIPSLFVIIWGCWISPPRRTVLTRFLILMIMAAIGASPLIYFGAVHGFDVMIRELAGAAISGASPDNYLVAVIQRASNLLLLGSNVIWGMRPPWEVRWLAWPLMPFTFAFWLLVLARGVAQLGRLDPAGHGRRLLSAVAGMLMLGFILTPFGADPSGRYFLPLAIVMALGAADLIAGEGTKIPEGVAGWLFVGVLVFNLWGNIESALRNPPGITTQFDAVTQIDHSYDAALMDFLDREGELRGYTNYWVAYPLAFLSEERLVFIPRLPYHLDFRYTPRYDRYAPYTSQVASSSKIAYITTNHIALDEEIRTRFREAGITWREAQVGDYRIYYQLSEPLPVEEIGERWLGE